MTWLDIENFKSIKKLNIKTKRVNIFIGEPNSGKSNILEALFLVSMNSSEFISDIMRGDDIGNIAHDANFNMPIHMKSDVIGFEISQNPNDSSFKIQYSSESTIMATARFGSNIEIYNLDNTFDTNVKFYNYQNINDFKQDHRPFLSPPFGQNLPTLLLGNSEFKKIVSHIFRDKDLRLVMKPVSSEIEIVKDKDDELYSYPYSTTSETLRRYAFMRLAIESNKESILVLDEPEANTFPFYSKMTAELIGKDSSNQYFISTHSPYLLMSLIEKTPTKDLNIIKTEMVNFETKATVLDPETYGDMLETGSDIFYELEKLGK